LTVSNWLFFYKPLPGDLRAGRRALKKRLKPPFSQLEPVDILHFFLTKSMRLPLPGRRAALRPSSYFRLKASIILVFPASTFTPGRLTDSSRECPW
jgi:hypothetical protein